MEKRRSVFFFFVFFFNRVTTDPRVALTTVPRRFCDPLSDAAPLACGVPECGSRPTFFGHRSTYAAVRNGPTSLCRPQLVPLRSPYREETGWPSQLVLMGCATRTSNLTHAGIALLGSTVEQLSRSPTLSVCPLFVRCSYDQYSVLVYKTRSPLRTFHATLWILRHECTPV